MSNYPDDFKGITNMDATEGESLDAPFESVRFANCDSCWEPSKLNKYDVCKSCHDIGEADKIARGKAQLEVIHEMFYNVAHAKQDFDRIFANPNVIKSNN